MSCHGVALGPQWDRRHSRLCHCSTFSVTPSPWSPACCGHGPESLGAFVHNHMLRRGRCFQRTGSACGCHQGRRWGQSSPGGQENLALRRVCPTPRPRPHLRGGQCVFPLTLRMVPGETDRSRQSQSTTARGDMKFAFCFCSERSFLFRL